MRKHSVFMVMVFLTVCLMTSGCSIFKKSIYKETGDTVTLIEYNGISKNAVIGGTYHDKPITKIATGAFTYCKGLRSIKILDSVLEIDDMAFFMCENVTSIEIGNNVERIGYDAFDLSINNIHIPASVKEIEPGAFVSTRECL